MLTVLECPAVFSDWNTSSGAVYVSQRLFWEGCYNQNMMIAYAINYLVLKVNIKWLLQLILLQQCDALPSKTKHSTGLY